MNSRTRVTQALRVAAVLGLLATSLPLAAALLPQLKVSDNHRFLVTVEGKPFFWLGDKPPVADQDWVLVLEAK